MFGKIKYMVNLSSSGFYILILYVFLCGTWGCGIMHHGQHNTERITVDETGAIVRMDSTQPYIYLIFSGHDHNEGRMHVLQTLTNLHIKASFFFTGEFYRNEENRSFIEALLHHGHYLGAHSDQHLLYVDWKHRDSTLVSRDSFFTDLLANYQVMESRFGITKDAAPYYLPSYEWYNREIVNWTTEMGFQLINLTPGPGTARDYTWPQMGPRYVPSQTIIDDLFRWEEGNSLNGVILLIHLGTDPRRHDKLYLQLEEILLRLQEKGYQYQIFKP